VHVIAAIVAVGANLTYSFWIRSAGLERERLAWTIGRVRRLDNLIATPAYIVLLITGLLMVAGGLFSFTTSWIVLAIVLYVLAVIVGIALYSPALRRQLAAAEVDPTAPAYREAAQRSNIFGILTLVIVLVIVALMVVKPTLW
jgi:uncharacterized membrane protein